MKKRQWVILNLDEGIYWFVCDAKSSQKAIEDYTKGCFDNIEKTKTLSIMAVEVKATKNLEVTVSKVLKTEIVNAL
jgi:hypothetical protein